MTTQKCGRESSAAAFVAFWALFLFATFSTAATNFAFAEAGDELLSAGLEEHRLGKYQEAIATFDRFIATYPNSTSRNKAELYDGHSHLSLGSTANPAETAKARTHFKYILDQGPNAEYYKEASFHNAYSYYDLRQYAEAEPLFEKFLAEYPKDAYVQYVYYYLGVCDSQSGAYQSAISYFDKNLTEYPDSPLRWTCRLDKAATVGKSGNFQEAERQLTELAAEPNLPTEVAGQVVVQRALLQIAQQKYDVAIQILEDFIARYRNDPAMAQVIQDAYLYEAYAYYAKKEFERALLVVETMERQSTTIAPEIALLKIKLLVNLNRVDEAEDLLNKLAASTYGQEAPDSITSERALISMARGDWDAAIRSLVDLLKVRQSPSNPNAVVINYYNDAATNPTTARLDPYDFVGACGVLTLSYASRYAVKKNEADKRAQDAIFKATFEYAAGRDDPGLDLIVAAVDARRKEALTNPINGDFAIVGPATGTTGNAGTGPNFSDPTNPNAPPTPGTGNNAGNGSTFAPGTGTPGNAGSNGNELFAPTGNQSQTTGSNYAPNAGTNAATGGTGTDANAGTNVAPESTPLTPDAARAALEKATTYYVNREYERANEILLEATTSSETFWKDCPAEAARISLLRANALFALDKRSEAQLTCQDLLEHAPFSPEATVANFYLGYGADFYGRRDEAIKYLRQAVSSKNESPFTDVALYTLGMNEWERRDVQGAERTFARLYRSYPQSAYWSHAVWALAKIESDARNDVVAEELVNEALRKKPDSAVVDYLLFLKGEIALRAKDYEKAEIAFEMIVDQYPDGIWFSKAKNRLASIPARFRDANYDEISSAVDSSDDVSAGSSPKPSAPNAGNSNSARPFDETRSTPSSTQNRTDDESGPPRRPNPPSGAPGFPPRTGNGGGSNSNAKSAASKDRRVYELSFTGDSVRF